MSDTCRTRAAAGLHGIPCDGPNCVYWRLTGQLDLVEGVDSDGCGVQHFELLGADEEVVRWLISVKERLEAAAAELDDLPEGDAVVFPDA